MISPFVILKNPATQVEALDENPLASKLKSSRTQTPIFRSLKYLSLYSPNPHARQHHSLFFQPFLTLNSSSFSSSSSPSSRLPTKNETNQPSAHTHTQKAQLQTSTSPTVPLRHQTRNETPTTTESQHDRIGSSTAQHNKKGMHNVFINVVVGFARYQNRVPALARVSRREYYICVSVLTSFSTPPKQNAPYLIRIQSPSHQCSDAGVASIIRYSIKQIRVGEKKSKRLHLTSIKSR